MSRTDPARTHLAGLRRLRGLQVRREHDGRIVLTDTFTSFKEVRRRTIIICALVTVVGFGAGLMAWKWALMPVWSVPIATALFAVGAVIASALTYWKYTWNGRTWSIAGDTVHIVAKQRGQKRVQDRVPATEIAAMSGMCTAGVFKRPHYALCIGHPNLPATTWIFMILAHDSDRDALDAKQQPAETLRKCFEQHLDLLQQHVAHWGENQQPLSAGVHYDMDT